MTTALNLVLMRHFPLASAEWFSDLFLRLLLLGVALFCFRSAQFRRELRSLFYATSTYVVVTLFVLILSLLFYMMPLAKGYCSVSPLFGIIMGLQVLFVPLLTMRMVAEERRTGTLELLLTAPVSLWEVVLAKYIACLVFYWMMIAPLGIYLGLLAWAGNVDIGTTLAGVVGLFLTGTVYCAVGIFCSSISRSQIAAAMLAMVILFVMFFLGDENLFYQGLWRWFTFVPHLMPMINDGMVDTGGVVYLLSLSALFIMLAWGALSCPDSLGAFAQTSRRRRLLIGGAAGAVTVEALLFCFAFSDIWRLSPARVLAILSARQFPAILAGLVLPGIVAVVGLAIMIVCFGGPGRFFRGLAVREGRAVNSLLTLAVLSLVLVNLVWFGSRHAKTYDFSDYRLNTLAPVSVETLHRLQHPLKVSVFFTSTDRYEGVAVLERTRKLITEFSIASSMVRPTYIDPTAAPLEARRVAGRFGIDFSQLADLLVLEYGEHKTVVPWDYLAPQQTDAVGRKQRPFLGEMCLISAINRLLDPRRTRIYFSEGRGEYDPLSMALSGRKAGKFSKELRIGGYELRRYMMGSGPVPTDCDILLIAGPLLPFTAADISGLNAYLERGGACMLLVDPVVGSREDQLHQSVFLKDKGVLLRQDTLFDPEMSSGGRQGVLLTTGNRNHPITAAGKSLRVQISQGRSLAIRSVTGTAQKWKATYLLQTSASAISLDSTQKGMASGARGKAPKQGLFGCAAALEGMGGGKLVVVGDADLLGNLGLDEEHNGMFLRSAIQWLSNRNYSVEVRPREDGDRQLRMTGTQRRITFWVALVGVPQIFLLTGILVWWVRRC